MSPMGFISTSSPASPISLTSPTCPIRARRQAYVFEGLKTMRAREAQQRVAVARRDLRATKEKHHMGGEEARE
eukprot:3631611-Pyramimonas_sp.AAC.2